MSEPPTRLICVGDSADQQELWLYIPSEDETNIRYLALSHCWGAAKIDYILTEDNYDDLRKKIDFERLTKNFKDAICFTREMGFKYVWIDSLCIKQGSREDWAQEAGRMSTVYAQAACTYVSPVIFPSALLMPELASAIHESANPAMSKVFLHLALLRPREDSIMTKTSSRATPVSF